MKKLFLISTCILLSFSSWAALTTITTDKVNGSPFYGGKVITVTFTIDANAKSGNVFTAQLSDKKGSFASPVTIGTLASTTAGPITCTIPLNTATGGKYLIRVVSSKPAVTGSPSPNSLKINQAPKNLVVSDITSCSATLSWDKASGASSYDVRYKATNGGDFSNPVNTTDLSYNFTALVSSTSYEFDVRAKYPTNAKSSYSAATSSTIACQVPTNLHLTTSTVSTATLDWNDATCAMDYSLRYRLLGSPTWIYKHPTVSTITLTGLCPACDYEAQVATRCTLTDSSAFTASDTWEQPYFRLASSTNENSVLAYPNPSNGSFTISFNNAQAGRAQIIIQNVFGQVVYQATQAASAGVNEVNVSLDNVAKGIYFVNVKSEGRELKTPMMVQ